MRFAVGDRVRFYVQKGYVREIGPNMALYKIDWDDALMSDSMWVSELYLVTVPVLEQLAEAGE